MKELGPGQGERFAFGAGGTRAFARPLTQQRVGAGERGEVVRSLYGQNRGQAAAACRYEAGRKEAVKGARIGGNRRSKLAT